VLCLLDVGKSPFSFFLFLLIISVQKIPISTYVLSHEWSAVSLTPTHTIRLPSYHVIYKHCYVGFIKFKLL